MVSLRTVDSSEKKKSYSLFKTTFGTIALAMTVACWMWSSTRAADNNANLVSSLLSSTSSDEIQTVGNRIESEHLDMIPTNVQDLLQSRMGTGSMSGDTMSRFDRNSELAQRRTNVEYEPIEDYDQNPSSPAGGSKCSGRKAALIWAGSDHESIDVRYYYQDMDFVFGRDNWVAFDLQETKPTQLDLIDYDVVYVEGVVQQSSPVAVWLNDEEGCRTLESLADLGKGIFVNISPSDYQDLKLPFGGTLRKVALENWGMQTSGSLNNNPLFSGPYQPVVETLDEKAAGGIISSVPAEFDVLLENTAKPSLIASIATTVRSGARVLLAGTTHNSMWKNPETGSLGSVEALHVRLNMFEYVCHREIGDDSNDETNTGTTV